MHIWKTRKPRCLTDNSTKGSYKTLKLRHFMGKLYIQKMIHILHYIQNTILNCGARTVTLKKVFQCQYFLFNNGKFYLNVTVFHPTVFLLYSFLPDYNECIKSRTPEELNYQQIQFYSSIQYPLPLKTQGFLLSI